ncbi:MAG TPA: ATP-binding protein [Micromonosporaceae bacterium]|nr:ATP-binding protein [Micromonosporaceae bacterium]
MVVAVVLVALAGTAAAVAAANSNRLDYLVDTAGPLRTSSEELVTALVNQETGVRGYALSGQRVDLGSYETGLERERVLAEQMTALLADRPDIRAQLDDVRATAERWRADVAQPVIEAAATSTAAAQALLNDEARQLFDHLRAEAARLQASILTLRDQVAEDARSTGNTLVLLLVIAAAVVVIAGAVLLLSLNRLVIGPVTGLAEQVRGVARGDYQRAIEVWGPPELAGLGRDVDVMRRKIASDLAEVREARSSIEWVNSQLQKQAEELVRSNRDLEQFAYVASHDLQEPLRKVASFCQLLQRRYAGKLDERADQYIAFAVDGAQRMQRLINDLLAFSRIGRVTAGFTEVDLNAVMGGIAAQFEATREASSGEVTWSDLPVVQGEESLLENLLANLVNNSLKFRRPDVPPRVHVSARRVDDELEITCQDNGIGIEPEFADKIFVIFQRLHAKDAYPGTGIGLAIVKKIVEYHGGRVWVESHVAEGTTIRFTLPAPQAQEPAEPTSGGATGDETTADGDSSASGADADGSPAGADPADALTAGEATGPDPGDGHSDDRVTSGQPASAGTGELHPLATNGKKETVA